MSLRLGLPSLLLLLAAPLAAGAQSPMAARPVVVRLSVGTGWAGPAAVVDTDRHVGPSFSLGIERGIAENWRALVEVARWQSSQGGGNSAATFGTASLELFPAAGTDFYVRGGVGFGSASLHAPTIAVNGSGYSVSGPAVQFGGGYDYVTGDGFGIGVFAVATNTVGGSAKDRVVHGSGEAALVSGGISLTWRR